jgi:transposase-like protein
LRVPKKIDPRVRDAAVELVRSGASLDDAAEAAGAHKASVRRWCTAAGVTPAGSIPEPFARREAARVEPGAPEVEDDAAPEDRDTLEQVRRMVRDLEKLARRAAKDHNHRAAQQYLSNAAKLVPAIARLEDRALEDDGALHISRAEVDQARDVVRERFAAIAARGKLRCADCARKLTISFGDDHGKDTPA